MAEMIRTGGCTCGAVGFTATAAQIGINGVELQLGGPACRIERADKGRVTIDRVGEDIADALAIGAAL